MRGFPANLRLAGRLLDEFEAMAYSLPENKRDELLDVKTIDVSGIPNGNYMITIGGKGIKGYTKQISIIH